MSLSSEAVTSSCESGEKQRERTGIACPVEEKETLKYHASSCCKFTKDMDVANYRSNFPLSLPSALSLAVQK